MRIELHIFGSRTGYGTLAATAGLSPLDCRILEGGAYRFGQPDSPDYLAGLARSPACFTRLLPGGRRGLTRVLAGAPDDTGRPTLRMVTAVLTQLDWDRTLVGDIGLLLADNALWHADARGPAVERRYAAPAADLPADATLFALAVLTQLERGGERPIALPENEASLDAIRALEILLPVPVRPRLTTAWQSLSRKLDVTVNAVAGSPAAAGLAGAIDRSLAPSAYVRQLTDEGVAAGRIATVLPRVYADFGRATVQADAAPHATRYVPPPPAKPRSERLAGHRVFAGGLIAAVAFVLAAGGIGWSIHAKRIAATQRAEQARMAKAASDEAERVAATQHAADAEHAHETQTAEAAARLADAGLTAVASAEEHATQAMLDRSRRARVKDRQDRRRRLIARQNESDQAELIALQLAATRPTDDESVAPPTTKPSTKPKW